EVKHQRAIAPLRAAASRPYIESAERERERREHRHLEPEERIDAQMTHARGRRRGFIEQQQARNLDGRTRARAQEDREQNRDADAPQQMIRTKQSHLPNHSHHRQFALEDGIEVARTECLRVHDGVAKAELADALADRAYARTTRRSELGTKCDLANLAAL